MSIASLLVELGAGTATFHSKMAKARKENDEFGGSVGKMAKASALAFAAVGAGAAAGLGLLVERSIQAAAENARFARSLNTSVESLTKWQFAAGTTNVSAEKMSDILKDVNDKIGDLATTGGGGAADLFKKMNLNVADFVKLAPDQQLLKLGESLDKVQTQAEKTFFLEGLAGDASLLLPLLDDGAKKFRALSREAEILGVAVSGVDAAKMEAANDAMYRAGGVVKGLGNAVASKVSPLIAAMATEFTKSAVSAGGFGHAVDLGFKAIVTGTGYVLDAFYPLELTFSVLKLGALALGSSIANIMAASGGAVSKFLTDFMTPFRVSFIGLVQLLDVAVQRLAEFGVISQSAAASSTAMAESISASIDSALQFDPGSIQALADGMAAAVEEQGAKIAELVNGPARSEQLQAWVDSVQTTAQKTAEAVAAGAVGGTVAIANEMAKRSELENFQYEQTLAKDSEFFLGLWVPAKDLQNEVMLAQAELHEKNLTDAQKAAVQVRIAAAKREAQGRQAAMQGMMANLQSLMNSGNRKMFEIGKAAAISDTVITTISSAQKSYDAMAGIPYIGPALGIAAAAAAVAAGVVRVQQIKSQKFGGGGSVGTVSASAPSIGGGGAPTVAAPTAPTPTPDDGVGQGPSVTFVINGNVSGNDARKLVAEIADVINTDDLVLIDPNSRNGRDLAALAA